MYQKWIWQGFNFNKALGKVANLYVNIVITQLSQTEIGR